MTPLAFFRTPEVQQIFERAAKAAGMPLSLHFVDNGQESPKVAAWGRCAACAHVVTMPNGRQACRNSRMQVAGDVMRLRQPVPFLCHMGFACVSAPALPEERFIFTLGPYIPMGTGESLQYDAQRGLAILLATPADEGEDPEAGPGALLPASGLVQSRRGVPAASGTMKTATRLGSHAHDPDQLTPFRQLHGKQRESLSVFDRQQEDGASPLPFPLDDLHHAPMAAVPALAQWLMEILTQAWQSGEGRASAPASRLNEQIAEPSLPGEFDSSQPPFHPSHPSNPSNPSHPAPPSHRGRPRNLQPEPQPYSAAAIAAAIAGDNQPLARELLLGVLAEAEAQPRRRLHVQRARMLAAVGAALEALENTGLDTAPGWEQFPECVSQARLAETPAALLDAAMLVLGPLRRRAAKSLRTAMSTQASSDSKPLSMDYIQLNEIVMARLLDNITLEGVAQLLGEKPSTISQRLRRKFGMSYSEYVGRLRTAKAKELLRRTQLSATEVAGRIGISDQSNFSKLFKRYEGMSPLEYRAKFGRK